MQFWGGLQRGDGDGGWNLEIEVVRNKQEERMEGLTENLRPSPRLPIRMT